MAKPQIDLKFGADLKDFRRGISNIDSSLKRLSGGFTALGATIGASFAVDAIRQFAAESVELGATMEGVRGAFMRFADPSTLDNLRDAVSGTVDDLKLMQMAVRAKNFKIPMDVLAKGLRFATQRAVETGESVDYLVESFVIGLGRESVKILDNLGISTLEIQRKTKEMGDMTTAVGAIMDEEFSKAGERVVTTSMKIDQQRAAVANLKTQIGEKLAPVYMAVAQGGLEFISAITNSFQSFTTAYGEMFRAIGLVKREQDRFGQSISETGKQRIDAEEKSLFRLNAMLESLQDNNLAEDQRRILINKINTEYKDYLPNLLSEKDTLEDIRDVAKQVNQTARERINQIIFQEKINKATEDGVQAQKDLNRLTIEQAQMVSRGGYYAMTIEQLRELGTSGRNMGHNFRVAAEDVITMNKNIDDARGRLKRAEIIIDAYSKRLNKSSESTEKLTDKTGDLDDSMEDLGNTIKEDVIGPLDIIETEFESVSDEAEETAETFDHSFRRTIETLGKFRDEFMMFGQILQQSFEAAFSPLEEGETRIGVFREVFVRQLKMMAAQLLATAAAAAILAAILTIAFGGTNLAGQAMFGKAGMNFGNLFSASFQGLGGMGFNGGFGGGDSNGFNIMSVIRGEDILLVQDRASRSRTRQRGF